MDDPLNLITVLAAVILLRTGILWIAMKLTGVQGNILHLLLASVITTLIELIPIAGRFISAIVLLGLIAHWTTADIFPDATLMVVVAWVIGQIIQFYLIAAMFGPK